MAKKNRNNIGLWEIVITFFASVAIYIPYFQKYMQYNAVVSTKLTELLSGIGIKSDYQILMISIVTIVCLVLLILVGFFVYKMIIKAVRARISDIKLLISIETGYAISFLISYLTIEFLPILITIALGNVVEMACVTFMCADELKGKKLKFILLRGVLVGLNMVSYRLSSYT